MDPPGRATAAQIANRKIKGAKGVRRAPLTSAGPSVLSPNRQQQTDNPPQGLFGNLPTSTFGASTPVADANSPQQPHTISGFAQQDGTPFGVSQSFPPNNASTSSGVQQGSQSTSFNGFGTGGNGVNFGGLSSGFSFTAQNANNPFTSSNGTAVSNSTHGMSAGFKGNLFSLPGSGDHPTAATPQVHPPASNPFGFPQTTQKQHETPFGTPFGQQSYDPQLPKPPSNPFGSSKPQTQRPLSNIFGQQSKESSQTGQSTSPFTQAFDSMQTSPDGSPHKPEESKSNPFSFLSSPVKPVVHSSQDSSTVNPFQKISQPSTSASETNASNLTVESSNSLFSRISQPSTLSPPSTETKKSPSNTDSGESQPKTAPFIVDKDSLLGSQRDNLVSLPEGSSYSAPKENPFVALKVPTAPQFVATESQAFSKENGDVNRTIDFDVSSSGLQSSTPTAVSSATSSTVPFTTAHKILASIPNNIPEHFTDAQKQSFITSHRLRSLNASFKDIVAATPDSANFTLIAHFYMERYEEIVKARIDCHTTHSSGKRKVDDFTSTDLNNWPGKKLKLGTPMLGSPLPSTSSRSHAESNAAEPSQLFNSCIPTGQSQKVGNIFSDSSKRSLSTAMSNHIVNQDIDTTPNSAVSNQVSYPALSEPSKPTEGSQTSNIFKNILGKADKEPPVHVPGSTANGIHAAKSFSFQSSSSTVDESPPSSASTSTDTFRPQTDTEPATSEQPAFQMPKFGSGATNFLAQFTNSAKETEKKEREKRKADEFDSDDDNEEDWERKDAEQQRAKKQKILEMSKGKIARLIPGKGFVFESDSVASETDKVAPTLAAGAKSVPLTSSQIDEGGVSRAAGSASSTFGGASVFDSKPLGQERALSITHNIFGHLSDAATDANGGKAGNANDEDSASEDESGNDLISAGQGSSSAYETAALNGNVESMSSGTKNNLIAPSEETGSDRPVIAQEKPGTTAQQSTTPGRSIFDRIAKDHDGNPIRESPKAGDITPVNPFSSLVPSSSGSLFGQLSSSKGNSLFGQLPLSSSGSNVFGSNTSPAGDHTFKHDSPIKFGATAVPTFSLTSATPTKASPKEDLNGPASPFVNLFGASKGGLDGDNIVANQSSSTLVGSPKSTDVGFGFGGPPKSAASSLLGPSLTTSAATSRASSPGATTDTGEESANESTAEGSAEDNSSHLNLTNGGPGEEDENVLYEVRAKALVFEAKQFRSRGVGLLRVLKHRETGKVRILLRQDPNGKLIINAALLSGVSYSLKGPTAVSLPIPTEKGTLAPWLIRVGKAESATELAKVLEDHKSS